MNENQFFWYMISQWAIALGSVVVAIVALWGHVIRARLFGPKLQIALKDSKGEAVMLENEIQSRYYHLRVWNERRAAPANNVRVVLKAIYRPNADGNMSQMPLSGPLQLTWQFQGVSPQYQTIGADSICDIGFLRSDKPFQLSTLIHHRSFNSTIQNNQKAIIEIVALSDECESNTLKLEIAWDGIWTNDSDELMRHMVLKQY